MKCLFFILAVALYTGVGCTDPLNDSLLMEWKADQMQEYVDSYVSLVDFMAQDEIPGWFTNHI